MMMFVCALVLVACNENVDKNSKTVEEVRIQTRFVGEILYEFYDEMFIGIINFEPEYFDYLGYLSDCVATPQKIILQLILIV